MPEFAEKDEPAPVPAPARSGIGGPTSAAGGAGLMTMLSQIGNQAGARLFGQTTGAGPTADPAADVAGVPEMFEALTFVTAGPYRGDVTPGTAGSSGGFSGTYDPRAGVFTVAMRCAVTFKDGITDSGGALVPADPALTTLVTAASALTGAARAAFLATYHWTDAEKGPWRAQLTSVINSAWGGRFDFHLNKPYWRWIGARVVVDLDVHDGPKAGTDHLAIDAVKFPSGENMYTWGGASSTGEGTTANAFDQSMTLASTDLGGRPDFNVLMTSIRFGFDSDVLTAGSQQRLRDWISTFNGAIGDPRSVRQTVNLVGFASQSGEFGYNFDLSQRRIAAVRDFLISNGFTNVAGRTSQLPLGELLADPDETARDRRVDLAVGDTSRQVLAAHEFGHAFGLDDEYADTPMYGGSGYAVGAAVGHDAQTRAMQRADGTHLAGAIAEETDSIMSAGNVMREQHYSTFHAALCTITRQTEWALGPAQPGAGP